MLWWLLVDNTLAYGEAFGLDGILWNLWNICKNISNFAIGAVFLFSIFRYILQQKGELKNVIKNCLIAGVLVQISWFLVATLIDVSTIATYGIWGLPLTLSKDASSTSSQKEKFTTLWEHLVIDSNDLDHTFNVFLTTKGWNAISPCNTVETKVDFTWFTGDQLKIFPLCLWKQASSCSTWSEYATTLIIWPKFFKTKDWWEEMTILTGFCHYNGNVFRYNDALLFSWVSDINQQINHRDQLSQTATFSWTDERFLWWALLSTNLVSFVDGTYETPSEQLQHRYGYIKRNDLDELFGLMGSPDRLFNVDELIEESKSYLGVFASLYSSLTNVIRFDKISSKYSSTFEQLTNVSIDLLYTLALFVPIITMVIVLGFRLVMVWAIIVLTPFIIVLRCFKDDLVGILWEDVKKQFTWDGTGWWFFTISNVIGTIFAPVIICFGIGISTILMSVFNDFSQIDAHMFDTMDIFTVDNLKAGMEDFVQSIVGIVSIVISRFLAFTCIKATKIWEKIGQSIQDLWEGWIRNANVIPLPLAWKQHVSFNDLFWSKDGVQKWVLSTALDIQTQSLRDQSTDQQKFWDNYFGISMGNKNLLEVANNGEEKARQKSVTDFYNTINFANYKPEQSFDFTYNAKKQQFTLDQVLQQQNLKNDLYNLIENDQTSKKEGAQGALWKYLTTQLAENKITDINEINRITKLLTDKWSPTNQTITLGTQTYKYNTEKKEFIAEKKDENNTNQN